MNTLYMTQPDYDLTLDSSRNIAMATEPYALAQDAASAIRTFKGEVYYNTTLGVPYFESILNHAPPLEYCRSEFIAAAMTVPGILAARVFFTAFKERQLSGQVQITSSAGVVVALGF
jgi:hypothetical protein